MKKLVYNFPQYGDGFNWDEYNKIELLPRSYEANEPVFVDKVECTCHSRDLFESGCLCGAFQMEKIKAESD